MPIVSHSGALRLPHGKRMAEEWVTSVSKTICSHAGENAPGFHSQARVTSGFLAFLCHQHILHFTFWFFISTQQGEVELRSWEGEGALGGMQTGQPAFLESRICYRSVVQKQLECQDPNSSPKPQPSRKRNKPGEEKQSSG